MATELALAAYRPKIGDTGALAHLLAHDVATLRAHGYLTARRAPLVRTENGDLLVVLEWSSEHAVDDAHTDPEVLAVWERKAQLADYLPPAALAGTGVPFVRWALLADL
jgi:hypothetical protein